jgi:diguanylate cyclase (GGDEF)-like protein
MATSSLKPYLLIADPDPAYLNTVKKLVEADKQLKAYTVWTAGSAVEVIGTMHNLDRETIFIVEYLFPDMNGHKLLKDSVRNTFRFASAHCIVTSHKDETLKDAVTADHILWSEKRRIHLGLQKEVALQSILNQYRSLVCYGEKDIELGLLIDPLTGCATRRHALMFWKHDFARARRDYRPISCIYADINNLKNINDSDEYGHHVGDQIIVEVSKALQLHVRNNFDYVVRWGGDEFVIILPEADLIAAKDILQRIREDISKIKVSVKRGFISPSVALAASVIQASYLGKNPEVAIEKLFRNAERAMYRDKRATKSAM